MLVIFIISILFLFSFENCLKNLYKLQKPYLLIVNIVQ